jgi:hypothetical protein
LTRDELQANMPSLYTTPATYKMEGLDVDTLVTKSRGDKPWRPGGPMALQRMAAATALLEMDRPNAWANVERAWCCQLLGEGLVYLQAGTLDATLCLGSEKWVTLVMCRIGFGVRGCVGRVSPLRLGLVFAKQEDVGFSLTLRRASGRPRGGSTASMGNRTTCFCMGPGSP